MGGIGPAGGARHILAILRGPYPIPSPAPVFRLAGGDTLIVVGTREGADAAAAILDAAVKG